MTNSGVLIARPARSPGVLAGLRNEIVGEVAFGDDLLLLGSPRGGLLDVAGSRRHIVRPRPRPVRAVPPPPGLVIGREQERAALAAAIEQQVPLEFHGDPGVGKTTLLRLLAHEPPAQPAAGIVLVSARAQPLDDLLQHLHDLFVDSRPPRKATHQQIRNALADVEAIVLLDDVQLEGDELSTLVDALPRSTVVSASDRPRLGTRGLSVPLRGLGIEQGLALIERALGRSLGDEDRRAGAAIVRAFHGNPLRLRQQLSLLAEPGSSLYRLAAELRAAAVRSGQGPASTSGGGVLRALRPQSAAEFRLVTLLAALPDTPVSLNDLVALTEVRAAGEVLAPLRLRGLVEDVGGDRYRLVGDLPAILARSPETEQWRPRALRHVLALVTAHNDVPERITEVIEPARVLLRWAVATERWAPALDLARGIEGALALARRWGAWAEVLQAAHVAARALGDDAGRAWALHQLGTRALCLGTEAGHAALVEALRIREQIGDRAGAEVTQHNLVCPLSSLAATGSFSRVRAEQATGEAADDPTEPVPIVRHATRGMEETDDPGNPGGQVGRRWPSRLRSAAVFKLTAALVMICGLGVAAGAMRAALPPTTGAGDADVREAETLPTSPRSWNTPTPEPDAREWVPPPGDLPADDAASGPEDDVAADEPAEDPEPFSSRPEGGNRNGRPDTVPGPPAGVGPPTSVPGPPAGVGPPASVPGPPAQVPASPGNGASPSSPGPPSSRPTPSPGRPPTTPGPTPAPPPVESPTPQPVPPPDPGPGQDPGGDGSGQDLLTPLPASTAEATPSGS